MKVISNQLKVLQVYQGLTRGHTDQEGTTLPVGLHFDPRSSSLVTNGLPGHIQFYNLVQDKHLFEVCILLYVCSTRKSMQISYVSEINPSLLGFFFLVLLKSAALLNY